MVIIHHNIVITNQTVCGIDSRKPGTRTAVDLAHAIRQAEIMSMNNHVQLCRDCWQYLVEKLQDALTEPETEIVEEG